MSIADREQELIAKLGLIEDPQERLSALMSRSKKWPSVSAEEKTEDHRVQGCQSRVWLVPRMESGTLRLRMDSDAPMVKGLVALMCEVFENATPPEAATFEPIIFDALGFTRMVTPTRLNGLDAVRGRIRDFALAQQG